MKTNQATRIALAAIVTLSGCMASTTPETDAHFGEAVTTLRAQQTLDPDASLNANPVAGIDGKAARNALHNYHESFRKPPAPVASGLTINVGGSSGGGQ